MSYMTIWVIWSMGCMAILPMGDMAMGSRLYGYGLMRLHALEFTVLSFWF
jgi:hypothetical protein